jgi:polar amino acid transport system substrate-binding protein
LIELAKYAFAAKGYRVRYQLMSWDRAVDLVSAGKKDCLLGAYKSDAPALLFPAVHQGVDQTFFIRRADLSWQYTGPEALRMVRIGFVDGYYYDAPINALASEPAMAGQVVFRRGPFALEENLQAIINGELDVTLDSRWVLQALMNKHGWHDKLEFAGAADQLSKIYIACSPAIEKGAQYVQWLELGTQQMRNSGELQGLLEKYGLKDWYGLPAVDN